MNSWRRAACIAALALVGLVVPAPAQVENNHQAEVLLQEAQHRALVDGDLERAIELCEKILTEHGGNRAVAAKALLQMGGCYEKLGNTEAQKAYGRIVEEYADQTATMAQARTRLAALISSVDNDKPLQPKFTKINIPTELSWCVKLSPDGKDLALVSDMKLWKMPLSGNLGPDLPGTPVQINTEGIEVEWTGLSWSGDCKWITFNENPGQDGTNESIYIVSSNGGKPKKIVQTSKKVMTVNSRVSLSPDGKKLAYTSIDDKKQYLQVISVDEGNPGKLTDMQAREPVFSPDGNLIAFVEDKKTGTGSGGLGLWVVNSNGGTPHLIADAGKASSPIWSPDGKMIAFLDNSNGKQINIVPVSNKGTANGRMTNIDVPKGTANTIILAGWTPENKIGVLLQSKLNYGLYTVPAKGGQAAIVLNEGNPLQPRWSGDNKRIYYTNDGTKPSWTSKTLAVVSANGGKGQVLPLKKDPLIYFPYQFQSGNRVSPDGKMIISAATSKETASNEYASTQIWNIPIDGGKPIQITYPDTSYVDLAPSWAPNGEEVAFLRMPLNKLFGNVRKEEISLYIVKSNGGTPELLTKEPSMWSAVWSPDGKTIAYLTSSNNIRAINIVNVIDGESQTIAEISNYHTFVDLTWSPDSKQIAFNDHEGKGIKVVSLSDGSIKDIATNLVGVRIYHLDWSPDGKRFVFAGMSGGDKEFWFLEDFLPRDKLAQKTVTDATPKTLNSEKVWTGSETDNQETEVWRLNNLLPKAENAK